MPAAPIEGARWTSTHYFPARSVPFSAISPIPAGWVTGCPALPPAAAAPPPGPGGRSPPLYALFPSPVRTVFGHLADPGRLGDWLPGLSAGDIGSPSGTGTTFPLTADLDGTRFAASGEITAF